MQVLERKFRRIPYKWQLCGGDMTLCTEFFPFAMPRNIIRTCWLSLHTTPSPDRIAVEIHACDSVCLITVVDCDAGEAGGHMFDDPALDPKLLEYRDKTLYVQCEYED